MRSSVVREEEDGDKGVSEEGEEGKEDKEGGEERGRGEGGNRGGLDAWSWGDGAIVEERDKPGTFLGNSTTLIRLIDSLSTIIKYNMYCGLPSYRLSCSQSFQLLNQHCFCLH